MIKKIFEKYEFYICMTLIALYIIINSFCIQNFGITDIRSVMINTVFSLSLLLFIKKIDRMSYYGLTKIADYKKYLYFIPLFIIVSINLWGGIHINHSLDQIIYHILTMFNIGFIEEIIFRGFLFKMMEKDDLNTAIIVSSITFGIGHIVNLLNGAELISTIIQIAYAISIGYLFVIIFHNSKSLIPCIITHSLFNAFSIFNENSHFMSYIVLIILPLVYAFYINKVNQ